MNTTQNSTKSKIVKVIGVDLAKDHCDVIGYDENGKICLRLDGCSYAKLREILSNLPQAVVLMEACKGACSMLGVSLISVMRCALLKGRRKGTSQYQS